ncbi:unnamed protein product [Danaus chrysippus]|uniref:(African queen) hypothetical protein n=1 Tax=Danaus chrysippus TaxID=151541 RepID=A0A8J2WDV8_9NEOP|nr:unnamed protein product [Danaus chrysippus]
MPLNGTSVADGAQKFCCFLVFCCSASIFINPRQLLYITLTISPNRIIRLLWMVHPWPLDPVLNTWGTS